MDDIEHVSVTAPLNPAPVVHDAPAPLPARAPGGHADIDSVDVYEIIRDIGDPEHPYTLEQLRVVREEDVEVLQGDGLVFEQPVVAIGLWPTVPHCTLAATIGLCVRLKLERDLPVPCKVEFRVRQHDTAVELEKQLNDKERVYAALQNPQLRALIDWCIDFADSPGEF